MRSASQVSPLGIALMMAAACTPVAVRNASRADERVVPAVPASRTALATVLAVLEELREVLIFELPEELHVEENQLHLRVSHPLADAEGGRVHAVGAELQGPQRVLEGESAVVVTVPVEPDPRDARPRDDALRELNEVPYAVRASRGRPCPRGRAA